MRKFPRYRPGWWIALLLIIAATGVAAAEEEAQSKRLVMPVVLAGRPPAMDCNVPDASFTSLSVIGPPLTVDPETNSNLNLGARGYTLTDAPLRLVELGPVHDGKAPQLPGLFGDLRTPVFTNAYDADPGSRWDVTLLGMGTTPGEIIHTPDSGYDIERGYEYLVMYASETRVTLHIGREDEFFGYVLHIEDVCVDPDLLALYRQLHAAGRRSLPALRGHDPFGRALGNEVKAAVRDWGGFMDPRSRNDWWQGR